MDQLFKQLAGLQEDMIRQLGLQPAGEYVELYLFRDEQSYRAFLKAYFPQLPYRRALYVKNDGPGMVFAYRSRQFEVDVRHECTHALLHASLPMVPLWLDEGLAEYFELEPTERAFQSPHLSPVRWAVRLGMISRLEKLEKTGSMPEMGGSEYRNAWAWIHFMLHGPLEAQQELIGFLGDIRALSPPGSLSRRLRQRLPDLERRFATHFKQWKR